MAELKPCPFCGGTPHLDREDIFCDCGAKMPIPIHVFGLVRDGEFPTYAEAKAEMIEAWNRRVPQTVVKQHGANCTHISCCGTLNLNL